MQLKRRALIKWTLITLFCGGHSFFWGLAAQGSVLAMIAGLATVILFFALIESSAAYQARRGRNAMFAQAMDLGIRIRVFFTLYVLGGLVITTMNLRELGEILLYGYMGEMLIGIGAMSATSTLFGFQLGAMRHTMEGQGGDHGPGTVAYFANTYVTTLLTAAAHTLILALLCAIIYGVLYLHGRKKVAKTPAN